MKVVKGDILSNINPMIPTAILHGCNCFNTMGAGIALYLANRFPQVREVDLATVPGDKAKLGTYTKAEVGPNLVVYNCYTQYRYGRGLQLDYQALHDSLVRVKYDLTNKFGGLDMVDIRAPKIGCGLAGGYWPSVELIFDAVMPTATIYEL